MNGENVAVVEGGVVYYVRTDHIGRPVFATDDSGAKVWEASYLPFGGVHTSTGSNSNLRFPGQWFQSEAGLHQNWMRDYDPTTGRYIQADPLGLVDGASVYGYALQNPGRYTDPTGQFVPAAVYAVSLGVTAYRVYRAYRAAQAAASVVNAVTGIGETAPQSIPEVTTEERPWRKRDTYKVISRCNVNVQKGCDENGCPKTIGGWGYGPSESAAGINAQHDANANLGYHGFSGCQARHCSHKACFKNGKQYKCRMP